MTKRAYPFEPCISRQMKIHFNDFELDKASLIEIQNRTFQKLFMAQKGIHNAVTSNLTLSKSAAGSHKNKLQIQKQVTSYLADPSTKQPVNQVLHNDSCIELSFCSYCSSETENLNKCNICSDHFCQSCSFVDYSTENVGHGICFTCS